MPEMETEMMTWSDGAMLPMVLSSPMLQGRATPENYVLQSQQDCCEFNGTQSLVLRDIYNQEEHVYFDSDLGKFMALTELGRPVSEYWNSQEDLLEQVRAAVDMVCKHNYQLDKKVTLKHQVKPNVNVSPSKKGPLQHHHLLVCHVTDFYPGSIEVHWFWNGQEETTGVVSTGLICSGDGTFQILVMLEMIPQQGDGYVCHMEHPSLDSPVTVEWRAQSDSAKGKMLTGVGGFVLGFIIFGVGIFMHKRSKKVQLRSQ